MGTTTAPFPAKTLSFLNLIRRFVAASGAIAIAVTGAFPASAQARGGGVPIIRDAEIEALVADYAAPILKVAGLGKRGVRVILVNSPSFNAFVDGRRIFVNTGAIMQAETPNEIIGVIAHESGHLAGGHQDRLREQLSRARTMAIIGM
ncbi:M48 family metallopeptidase, partial [Brucella melitensis]